MTNPRFIAQMPRNGACSGPMHRSLLRVSYAADVNAGCAKNQILYYVDGDVNNPKCGQCVPGTSGADDEYQICGLQEYCSDNATCVDIRKHPLFGAACPYEPQVSSANAGFCGAGLHCYNHKCLPCLDGMVDYADGKMCVTNVWTYNKWENVVHEPTPTLLSILLGLGLAYAFLSIVIDLIICCVKDQIKRTRKRRERKEQLEIAKLASGQHKPVIANPDDPMTKRFGDAVKKQQSNKTQPVQAAPVENVASESEDDSDDDDEEQIRAAAQLQAGNRNSTRVPPLPARNQHMQYTSSQITEEMMEEVAAPAPVASPRPAPPLPSSPRPKGWGLANSNNNDADSMPPPPPPPPGAPPITPRRAVPQPPPVPNRRDSISSVRTDSTYSQH